MSDLVTIDGQQVVTSSRNVAEHFEKRHADVLETIEKLKTENSVLTKMFFETTYKVDGNNKSYKEYLMNRDGFSLLVMGFTGAKALAWKLRYIEAFNAMEAKLADRGKDSYMIADPVDRAKKWIEEEEVRQRQAAELEAAKPKVVFADAVAAAGEQVPHQPQGDGLQHADAEGDGDGAVRNQGEFAHQRRRSEHRDEDVEGHGQGAAVFHQPLPREEGRRGSAGGLKDVLQRKDGNITGRPY